MKDGTWLHRLYTIIVFGMVSEAGGEAAETVVHQIRLVSFRVGSPPGFTTLDIFGGHTSTPVIAQLVERRTVVVDANEILRSPVRFRFAGRFCKYNPFGSSLASWIHFTILP